MSRFGEVIVEVRLGVFGRSLLRFAVKLGAALAWAGCPSAGWRVAAFLGRIAAKNVHHRVMR